MKIVVNLILRKIVSCMATGNGKLSLLDHSLPSPTVVTKNYKVNGITQSLPCQFYSEVFVLLPVSHGYTNVTITGSKVLLPHLPELISSEDHDQIMNDEERKHRTLAAMETIARRSSPTNQQSYVCGNCWSLFLVTKLPIVESHG
jgi:hypothetical protein